MTSIFKKFAKIALMTCALTFGFNTCTFAEFSQSLKNRLNEAAPKVSRAILEQVVPIISTNSIEKAKGILFKSESLFVIDDLSKAAQLIVTILHTADNTIQNDYPDLQKQIQDELTTELNDFVNSVKQIVDIKIGLDIVNQIKQKIEELSAHKTILKGSLNIDITKFFEEIKKAAINDFEDKFKIKINH
jgi:hypothetical protein